METKQNVSKANLRSQQATLFRRHWEMRDLKEDAPWKIRTVKLGLA